MTNKEALGTLRYHIISLNTYIWVRISPFSYSCIKCKSMVDSTGKCKICEALDFLEKNIVQSEVLGVRDDEFYDLGGHYV